jgi:hypothetical protein
MRLRRFACLLRTSLVLTLLALATHAAEVESVSSLRETKAAGLTAKLRAIIVPRVEFRGATLREAVDFLAHKSRAADQEPDPAKRGVNLLLKAPQTDNPVTLTLNVAHSSLHELLQAVAKQAGLELTSASRYVLLAPPGTDAAKVRVTVAPDRPDAQIVGNKLSTIIIPRLDFRGATLREAFGFLSARARQFDLENPNPKLPFAALAQLPPELAETRLTMSLQNLPLRDAMEAVAVLAGIEVILKPDEIVLKTEQPGAAGAATMEPPSETRQLTEEEVIRIAVETAQHEGYDLTEFAAPRLRYYPKREEEESGWFVHFQGLRRAPGNFFTVWIDDKTRKAELFAGQ